MTTYTMQDNAIKMILKLYSHDSIAILGGTDGTPATLRLFNAQNVKTNQFSITWKGIITAEEIE